jgi:hypothetical protein
MSYRAALHAQARQIVDRIRNPSGDYEAVLLT